MREMESSLRARISKLDHDNQDLRRSAPPSLGPPLPCGRKEEKSMRKEYEKEYKKKGIRKIVRKQCLL